MLFRPKLMASRPGRTEKPIDGSSIPQNRFLQDDDCCSIPHCFSWFCWPYSSEFHAPSRAAGGEFVELSSSHEIGRRKIGLGNEVPSSLDEECRSAVITTISRTGGLAASELQLLCDRPGDEVAGWEGREGQGGHGDSPRHQESEGNLVRRLRCRFGSS